VNHIWRVGVGGRVHKSTEGKAWADNAAWLVKASGVKVTGPYILRVTAVRPDKRRRDLGNLDKAVSDALQDGGAVEDDCMCQAALWSWEGVGVGMTMHSEAIGLPVVHVRLEGK
jgi:Holliday junction resolvase RusA-like endonuclease